MKTAYICHFQSQSEAEEEKIECGIHGIHVEYTYILEAFVLCDGRSCSNPELQLLPPKQESLFFIKFHSIYLGI